MSDWNKDFTSAPRDGTRIQVCFLNKGNEKRQTVVHWKEVDGVSRWCVGITKNGTPMTLWNSPTHWRPTFDLPEN